MTEFLCLCDGTLQTDRHITKRTQSGFRIYVILPVFRRITRFQLKHGKTENICRLVDVSAGKIDSVYPLVIGDQNIDLTPNCDLFCIQHRFHAGPDDGGNRILLKCKAVKGQIDLMLHVLYLSFVASLKLPDRLLFLLLLFGTFIGVDDLLDQRVTHHIRRGQTADGNILYVLQYTDGIL